MPINVLIISNNVLSKTSNNGKTLYSLFRGFPEGTVSQLFFSGEMPNISGYNYYQLSDADIFFGKASRRFRGRAVTIDQHAIGRSRKNSRGLFAFTE